jgi:hypothetical protein
MKRRTKSKIYTSKVMEKSGSGDALRLIAVSGSALTPMGIRNSARETAFLLLCLCVQGGGGARLTGHIQIEGNEEQLRQTINDIEARSDSMTITAIGLNCPLAENSAA